MRWVGNATPWLFRFVQDSVNGQPSVKRYGLALAITVLSIVVLLLGVVIVAMSLGARPEDEVEMMRLACNTLETLVFMLLATVTGNYLVDKANARKIIETEKVEKVDD